MRSFRYLTALFGLAACGMVTAQVPADSVTSIVDVIEQGVIIIDQPAGLAKRVLLPAQGVNEGENGDYPSQASHNSDSSPNNESNTAAGTGTAAKVAGYRVQVFSDNNARTAKSEARSKAQNISARLPQYRTYVVYQSPFWRLKVGDFITESEAETAADEIKKLFPSFAREVRVVKDRINK